jgi:hypothetical protein
MVQIVIHPIPRDPLSRRRPGSKPQVFRTMLLVDQPTKHFETKDRYIVEIYYVFHLILIVLIFLTRNQATLLMQSANNT